MNRLLEAHGIGFAYTKRAVLRDVDVALAEGEVLALLGPNGSGKSTLIKVLLGQLHAAGEVIWEGRGIASWGRRELARRVAYLPQNPTWDVEQRVGDVLRLGRAPYWGAFGIESGRDARVVEETAELLGLWELMNRRMDELSGGQRQRVFAGRCLVQEPRAMLLDEPSTFLDLRHQVELCQLLRRLAKEKRIGVLMASHDLNLAGAYADRMVLLSEGAVAADGAPNQVLDADLLSRVYSLKMRRIECGEGRVPIVVPS